MGDRRAEERHDRVADELLHRPSVALDLGLDPRPVRSLQRAHLLRVEPLRLRGEADEVGEEDGDALSLLARRLGLAERGPARETEPGALRVFLAALQAGRHAGSLGRYLMMFTARAATRRIATAENADSMNMASLARRVSGIASVGLNAIELVNET